MEFALIEFTAVTFNTNGATVAVDVMRAKRPEYKFTQFALPTPKGT